MWNNRRKLKIEMVVNKRIPTIKIKDKHEKIVKRAIWVLTAIGILISVVTFSAWYFSLMVAIILFLIGQFLDKVVFTYSVMLVQPLPEKWDGSVWSLMAVGFFEDKYALAFGFDDKEVADDFFDTLLKWNDGNTINDGNICISLVLEDSNNYSIHVYPSVQRDFIIKGISKMEEEHKLEKYGKEQTNLLVQIDFCKVFPHSDNSAYSLLDGNNKDILVCTYDTSAFDVNIPKSIDSVRPYDERRILCKEIMIKKRNELDSINDFIEYYHIPKY